MPASGSPRTCRPNRMDYLNVSGETPYISFKRLYLRHHLSLKKHRQDERVYVVEIDTFASSHYIADIIRHRRRDKYTRKRLSERVRNGAFERARWLIVRGRSRGNGDVLPPLRQTSLPLYSLKGKIQQRRRVYAGECTNFATVSIFMGARPLSYIYMHRASQTVAAKCMH